MIPSDVRTRISSRSLDTSPVGGSTSGTGVMIDRDGMDGQMDERMDEQMGGWMDGF